MIDVTSDEFKQAARDRLFSNTFVKSGIVQIVSEPLEKASNHHRCMGWDYASLSEYLDSEQWAGGRVGDFASMSIRKALVSIINGVVEVSQLKQPDLDGSDHTLALVPGSVYLSLVTTRHICPFTKTDIDSYNGKQLVHVPVQLDESFKSCLLYPGEIKLFLRIPEPEIELAPDRPGSFTYYWQYDVSVAGFEYVGPENPNDKDLSNPGSWKQTGTSRIVRVS